MVPTNRETTTIEAFVEHGVIDPGALTDDVDGAFREIAALADLGIDFDGITATLQTEGVRAFADSMDELYTTLGEKIAAIRS